MTQSLHQSIGGFSLPFTAADIDDDQLSFCTADPAQATLMALFTAAINAELTAAWVKVCASLGKVPEKFSVSLPVADTLEIPPSINVMSQRVPALPLLALHRSGEATFEQTTLEGVSMRHQWLLHYILGPLDVGAERKLLGVLPAVAKIVALTINRAGHPAYQDGAVQLLPADTSSPGAVSSCRLVSALVGEAALSEDKDVVWHACLMTLETTEDVSDDIDAYGPFTGIDFTIGVGNAREILPELLYVNTDYPGTWHTQP